MAKQTKTTARTAKSGAKAGGRNKGTGAEPSAQGEDKAPEVRQDLKLKALVDAVSARSAVKKKDARAVIEAALDEIGRALSSGQGFALPPLGKGKVNRQKDGGKGEVLVVKIRRGGPVEEAGAEGLAETDHSG